MRPTGNTRIDAMLNSIQEAFLASRENAGLDKPSYDFGPEINKADPLGLLKEVRIVDPVTGGEKGSKLARFDLIPMDAMWHVAEVYGRGAQKYADRNWEKGYKWGLSVAAMLRHLSMRLNGEVFDEETGSRHMAQVVWHALALLTFEIRRLGTDDVTQKKLLNKDINAFRAGSANPVEYDTAGFSTREER